MSNQLFSFDDKNLKEEKIDSVSKLIKKIEQNTKSKKRIYYRGHSEKKYKLIPSIARFNDFKYLGIEIPPNTNFKEAEKNFLTRFRKHTYEHKGRILSMWEALFLARHYELPVRLLDWSTNPLVALYNATFYEKDEDVKDKDGIIWYFTRKEYDGQDIDVYNDTDPLNIPGVRLIYPFNPTPKMTAQCSVFTIHQHPWEDLRYMKKNKYASQKKPNKNNHLDIKEGGRYVIPYKKKKEIQLDLYKLGINTLTLHLDLPHIVTGLKQRESINYLTKPEKI
ncbi:FRG domain protein [bacterium BMS3Abin10]|nr:FRG domain protein [bacterium BMS3Abin10]